MKIHIITKSGIRQVNVKQKNLNRYQFVKKIKKSTAYNQYNKPKRKHKSRDKHFNYSIRVYRIIEPPIPPEPNPQRIKQMILERFMIYKSDNPKMSNNLYRALADADIRQEDDGHWQISNLQTPGIRKDKFKLRVDKDLRQFKLIIEDNYMKDKSKEYDM